MALELIGRIVKIMPEQTGAGKNGSWSKQEFVIETNDQYPKKICCSAWGDKTAALRSLKSGDEVKVSFNIESREYNERWYTDVRAWKIETMSNAAAAAGSAPAPDFPFPADEGGGDMEDLPF